MTSPLTVFGTAALLCAQHLHPIVVAQRKNRQPRQTFLFQCREPPPSVPDFRCPLAFISSFQSAQLLQSGDGLKKISRTSTCPGWRRRLCAPMPPPRPCQRIPISKNRRCV